MDYNNTNNLGKLANYRWFAEEPECPVIASGLDSERFADELDSTDGFTIFSEDLEG